MLIIKPGLEGICELNSLTELQIWGKFIHPATCRPHCSHMLSAGWSCAQASEKGVELGMSIIPPKFTVSNVTAPPSRLPRDTVRETLRERLKVIFIQPPSQEGNIRHGKEHFGVKCSVNDNCYHYRLTGTYCFIFLFSSVAQSCPTLCDPINCSTPGLPVHHQLPEFSQTHDHWVGDAIHPFHSLTSPSPPAPNPSQHQSLFQWVSSSHQVGKGLKFQL